MLATILAVFRTDLTLDLDIRVTDDEGNYLGRHNLNLHNAETVTQKEIEMAIQAIARQYEEAPIA